ncbi:MAG: hypothetical protein WCD56_14275 [Pseudolabrys sp.]
MSAHEALLIRLTLGSSPLRKTPDVGIKADIGPDQHLRLVERQRTADRQAGGNGALAEPVHQETSGSPRRSASVSHVVNASMPSSAIMLFP